MSRNEPPTERQAWLDALKVFDEAHDWLEQLVEEEARRAEGKSNGR